MKEFLVKTAGKTTERNYVPEGMCSHHHAEFTISHRECFDATKQYHKDVTGAAEQVLICFPNKNISCKYLFMEMPSLHCYHSNMTNFQLIAHQKEIDKELSSGVLQWMPKEIFVLSWSDLCCLEQRGITWQNTYLCPVWTWILCGNFYIHLLL